MERTLIRKAFVLEVNAGCEAEYERRHRPIWAELESILKAHGAHHYSIFLHPDKKHLFAYAEIEDEDRWNAIAKTEVCQKWWKWMSEIMETNSDMSPKAENCKEVFHLRQP